MTKHQIAEKILDLLQNDVHSMVPAILTLASEVKQDAETDDFCNKDWSGLQGGF